MALFGFRSLAVGNRQDDRRSNTSARGRRQDRRRARTRLRPIIDVLEERALLSNVVTVMNDHDSGAGSLRDAINNATSGEIIKFAPSASGTITLTSGSLMVNMIDLTIQGPGSNKLTISGGGNFTDFILFSVLPPTDPPAPNFVPNKVNISGLTIANGNAISNGFGGGGGILSADALTISNSVLENNQAPVDGGLGGAIFSLCCGNESLTIDNDLFAGNSVGFAGDTAGGFQQGGAIFNDGVATISSSTFVNNQALGSNALGGAIHTTFGSTLTVTGSTFVNNEAIGSGLVGGGAIFGDPALVTISSSQFLNNEAVTNSPFEQASGGAVETTAFDINAAGEAIQVTEVITNSLFSGNLVVGAAGSGASVQGGAIENGSGTLDVAGSTFTGNQAIGGSSTSSFGGVATGGAVVTVQCNLNLSSDSFFGNDALGGSSPMGVQFAIGGAVNVFLSNFSAPNTPSTISNSLFSGNEAAAGTGGGSFSLTGGGAIAFSFTLPYTVSNTRFLGNQVIGSQGQNGGAGTEADGGAIWADGSTVAIQGGLIAGNSAVGGRGGDAPGGTGGDGGIGGGGGIANLSGSSLTITGTTIAGNSAAGGAGGRGSTQGTGGNGLGAGIENDGASTLDITSSILLGNVATGGAGGGNGYGAGVYTLGTTTFTDTLVTLNLAIGGSDGGQGVGGGIYIAGGTTTLTGKTKVVGNQATTSNDNIYGPYST